MQYPSDGIGRLFAQTLLRLYLVNLNREPLNPEL